MSTPQEIPGRLRGAIMKRVRLALADYQMFQPGEEVMVGVSGKDSLALVWLLRECRPAPRFFAIHVDPGFHLSERPALAPIRECLERWKVPLHVVRTEDAGEIASGGKNPCFICTRRRREVMLRLAAERSIRTVALGHKQDDFVETLLLNVLFSREVSCMHPRQPLFKGQFHVIRPLAYVEDRLLQRLVRHLAIPDIPQDCPHAAHSRRNHVREFLDGLKREHPDVIHNAFLAMGRVKPDFLPVLPGQSRSLPGVEPADP